MSLFQTPAPLSYPNGYQPSNVEIQQKWYQPQPIQPQQPSIENNPYTNAVNEINACPANIRAAILNDPEVQKIKSQVDDLMFQYAIVQALPLVIQNQQHNFLLEKYFQTVLDAKSKSEKQAIEIQKNIELQHQEVLRVQQQIQEFTNDPVIAKRLLELNGAKQDEQMNIEAVTPVQNSKKGGK